MHRSPIPFNHLTQDFSLDEVEGSNEPRKGLSQTTMALNTSGYFKRLLVSGQCEHRLGMERCHKLIQIASPPGSISAANQFEHSLTISHGCALRQENDCKHTPSL